ncbi:MAG: CPBP family intramembrane metalloprotease [Chloroflexi bacterium]|nr:CPBP family intramembrane metalloprotease [Chloroflexota bacterium]
MEEKNKIDMKRLLLFFVVLAAGWGLIVMFYSFLAGGSLFSIMNGGGVPRWLAVSYLLTLYVFVVLTIIYFWTRVFHIPFRALGLGGGIKSVKLFSGGVCLGLFISIIYGMALFMASGKAEAGFGENFGMFLFLNILSALGIAFGEELLFRGFFLGVFSRRWGLTGGVLASSFLFALAHIFSPGAVVNKIILFTGLVILGSLLCIAFIRTGILWLSVGIHSMLILGSIVESKADLRAGLPAMLWGGNWNHLSGIMGLAAILLLLVLVLIFFRKNNPA